VQVPVVNLPDAIDVATDSSVSCARRQTGETDCWGRNDYGQLGINESGTGSQRDVPTPVMNLPDAVQVAVGTLHACAIRSVGEVVCWGNNSYRQVNDSTTTVIPLPAVVGL
jgi:alpha-tubulin suppressor-like RCC1 family protein